MPRFSAGSFVEDRDYQKTVIKIDASGAETKVKVPGVVHEREIAVFELQDDGEPGRLVATFKASEVKAFLDSRSKVGAILDPLFAADEDFAADLETALVDSGARGSRKRPSAAKSPDRFKMVRK